MTGVEILTSTEVVSEAVFNWTAFWITFGIVFTIIEVIAIISWASGDAYASIIPCFALLGVVGGTIFGTFLGDMFKTPIAYENEYKVTISDEVSLNEFYERYEVIKQEGKIFTVREKQN